MSVGARDGLGEGRSVSVGALEDTGAVGALVIGLFVGDLEGEGDVVGKAIKNGGDPSIG